MSRSSRLYALLGQAPSSARTDLCGGPRVTGVPTATLQPAHLSDFTKTVRQRWLGPNGRFRRYSAPASTLSIVLGPGFRDPRGHHEMSRTKWTLESASRETPWLRVTPIGDGPSSVARRVSLLGGRVRVCGSRCHITGSRLYSPSGPVVNRSPGMPESQGGGSPGRPTLSWLRRGR
jgi:hypothetical protein